MSGAAAAPSLLSVIVPSYNEGRTIRNALDALLNTQLQLPIEVIVVDDGSTDGTADDLAPLVDTGTIRLVRHPMNLGKGSAICTGLNYASGDIASIYDADGELDPSDYVAMLRPILDGRTRVVYGSRTFGVHSSESFGHAFGNRLVNLWASVLFATRISDVETCFKMATTDLWRSLELTSPGFGIEAEATAKFLSKGERIFEVPISYRPRTRAEGKKIRWRDGAVALAILMRVRVLGR
jgi:glycosyltransferase involved in cell wall biosynthesis